MKAVPEKPPQVNVGEEWAYREKAGATVTRVTVTRIGTTKPLRVRVRFADDHYEGGEEWVPPNRLKVRWEGVTHWQEREDRWEAVRDASHHIADTLEYWAANSVFDALSDIEVRDGYGRDAGILTIGDIDRVCAALDVEKTLFLDEPLTFVDDDDSLVAPWAVTDRLARHVAPLVADRILAEVERDETKHRQRALYGERYTFDGQDRYMSPEKCAELDEPWKLAHEVLRRWCGVDAVERFDELLALCDDVLRVGQIAERAIRELDAAGAVGAAEEIRRELGVPVETLRASAGYERRPGGSSGP